MAQIPPRMFNGLMVATNSIRIGEQVGRKRIPLYYYSDFQDIGLSYPWVSPPPELYGWEVTNYNGGSLRYNDSFGDTNFKRKFVWRQ